MTKRIASSLFAVLAIFAFTFSVRAMPANAATETVCCSCDPDCVPANNGNIEATGDGDDNFFTGVCMGKCEGAMVLDPKKNPKAGNCNKNQSFLAVAYSSCAVYDEGNKNSQGAGASSGSTCGCDCIYKDTNGNDVQTKLSGPDANPETYYPTAVMHCQTLCAQKNPDFQLTKATPNCTPAPVSCDCGKGKPAAQAFAQKDCKDACVTAQIDAAAIKQVDFILPERDFPAIFGRIIKALLGVSGSLTFAMILYGGFLYLTSGGSPETITRAKNIVIWAALGLVIIFTSYAIVTAIFTAASSATGVKIQSAQLK